MKRIRYSVDYYNLNDEGLEKFNDDFETCKDTIEDLENKIYICQYMIDTIELVSSILNEEEIGHIGTVDDYRLSVEGKEKVSR